MCGLVGLWCPAGTSIDIADVAWAMSARVAHRGPDDTGVWSDKEAGVALAHRRLSIMDLSPAGHQPMISSSGRYVLTYNGEIYNHRELRETLRDRGAAPSWRGHSDTEVLLAALAHWGVAQALDRLNGMFAFALWDRHERCLYLARDRFGEKPLYYGRIGNTFVFGSELKALRACPGFDAGIDRAALSLFMRRGYVPAPWSIYEGIAKLPAGHWVQIASPSSEGAAPRAYWDPRQAQGRATDDPLGISEAEAIVHLDGLLSDAVRLRSDADVPLGAFLSGGYDSSLVVALMQSQASQPVHTFSIGNHAGGYDEAEHARAVAAHLGTDHHELYVTADDALAVVPELPAIYDEPFADSSQIPTCLVSSLTRRQVTVALSGDGGDELFGGYNRHVFGAGSWRRAAGLPLPLRMAAAGVLRHISPSRARALTHLFHRYTGLPQPGEKLSKLGEALAARDEDALYLSLISQWREPDDVVVGGRDPIGSPLREWRELSNVAERMMMADLVTYLPDDILAKVDRASMASSLESRMPFLDHRLPGVAGGPPLSFKIRNGRGKWILRQVLHRYVPEQLMARPKQGFAVPLEDWLRGPLRDWAEALLDERLLREAGYLKPEPVRVAWRDHLQNRRNHQHKLWNVLMFQAWLERGSECSRNMDAVHRRCGPISACT